MKKLFLLLIVLPALLNCLSAQDKVITLQGDTVICKVVRYTKKEVIIEIDNKGIISKGVFKPDQISGIEFSTETMNTESGRKSTEPNKINESLKATEGQDITNLPSKKFSVTLKSGYGYLMGNTTTAKSNLMSLGFDVNSSNNYYNKLRNTLLTSVELQYSLFNFRDFYNLSMGVYYQNQHNSSSIKGIMGPYNDVQFINGQFTESIFCNVYGYILKNTLWLNRKKTFNIFTEGGIGITTYRNEQILGYSPILIQTIQTGSYSNTGIEMRIYQSICLNASIGLFVANVSKFKVDDGYTSTTYEMPDGQYESLSKISTSVGLTYRF